MESKDQSDQFMELGIAPEGWTDDLNEEDWNNIGEFIMNNKGAQVVFSRQNPAGETFEFILVNENPETRHFSINCTDDPQPEELCRRLRSFRKSPAKTCGLEWNEPTWADFNLVALDDAAIKMAADMREVPFTEMMTERDLKELEPYLPEYLNLLTGKAYLLQDVADLMDTVRLARPLQEVLRRARGRKESPSKARRRKDRKLRVRYPKPAATAA